jgi:predicted ATPase
MTLALGGAGAVALTTLGAASGPVSAPTAPAAPAALHVQNGGPDPCILAISYANQWGICIQPPTN